LDSASIQFVLFALVVAVLSNVSRSPAWRSAVLLIASLAFLGLLAHDPLALLPLAGFLLLGYLSLLLVNGGASKWLVATLLTVILAYVWLKKYTFLPEAVFLRFPYLTLGLSYIFFRVLHLIIDTGEAAEPRRVGIGAYLLYTLNFTTLVSGPIQRFEDFARDQYAKAPIELGAGVVGLQLERMVRGFFKVNILAMLLHAMQENSLTLLSHPVSPATKMLAAFQLIVVYPFFLYANFSGYIDIVIAAARLMRVQLPENFNRPFSAASFMDFWTRWHITLSNWLKTYVYNPLLTALMQRITASTLQPYLGVFCFFVTFFLIGIWHGRTSEFLVYGLLLGGGISINKLWQVLLSQRFSSKRYKALAKEPLYIAFGRGLTFSWFSFTLFWFWADWHEIDGIFSALPTGAWLEVWGAVWLCATAVLALWESLRAALLSIAVTGAPLLTSRYARVVYASAFALTAFVITVLLNQPAPDIVYKAF
jgi:D-alanyl-lipoteichoic acid acyltransferase DltB (MBOAT superfamily)